MPQNIVVGHKQLMAEAEAQVSHVNVAEALEMAKRGDVVIVDIRDIREVQREGRIPGSLHAPRGMLEFWVDPESPYYKPVFTDDKTFILYCQADWRGTLAAATLTDMGMANVLHLQGGFGEWRKTGAPTAARPDKTRPDKK